MFKKNEYIVYKQEICKIIDIIPNYAKNQDYYLLSQVSDDTLTIKIPTNNENIRSLITKKEIDELINQIPLVEVINGNTKSLEPIYKQLISSSSHKDLIKIIKTCYLRNKERIDNKRKTTDKDTYYFHLAEKYLYNELSIVLNLTYDQTKEYIIKKVSKLTQE